MGSFALRNDGIFINPDTHGGNLQRSVQSRQPEEQIAVEIPVIIVRCSAVMRLAASFQRLADLLDEDALLFPGNCIFPVLDGKIRIQIFQLLGSDEIHVIC